MERTSTKELRMTATAPLTGYDRAAIEQALVTDGITALRGAFSPEWADRMREDIEAAFEEAISREGGAVGRGPNRYYVEIHPQQLRGFLDIVSHPWFRTVCETVLGPDYQVLELGFDIPFAGAQNQPWHRDFPSPPETHRDRRLTSLAFNLTAVDTGEDMGPFEIAPGTQWEPGLEWKHRMFPPREEWARFESIAQRKYPRRGDISARSALTLHRGTANHSSLSRPVLVVGVDAPGAGHDAFHDMAMTREYSDAIPEDVRRHLLGRVVDRLEPIVQQHTIEGLVMGEA
jgi:ectoine hydroxylase-related dioxygenase (phytanoyl-CoA dioxygenase family)